MDAMENDLEMSDIVVDVPKFDRNRRFQRRRPRQRVPHYVDWKDIEFLRRFIPERGKIMPRRISGVTAKEQRKIAAAIKRARYIALIPFVGD